MIDQITSINNIPFYTIPFDTISGYAISKCGQVASNKSGSWTLLKLTTDKTSGYLLVTLTTNSKESSYYGRKAVQKTYSLHKILFSTFVAGRDLTFNEVVDHKDNNRSNNALDNLQLLSRGENARKGKQDSMLTDNVVMAIYHESLQNKKMSHLQKLFPDVSRSRINSIIYGIHYCHLTGLPQVPNNGYKKIAETKAADTYIRLTNAALERKQEKKQAKIEKKVKLMDQIIEARQARKEERAALKLALKKESPSVWLENNTDYIQFTEACHLWSAINACPIAEARVRLTDLIITDAIKYEMKGKRVFILKSEVV